MKYPEVIRKIEENVISKPIKRTSVPKQKKIIQEKVSQQKVVQPRANSWREWTSFESEDLKIYLMGLTLKQIKPKLGKLLTSSEKKLRKADLIDTIVKKIKKLKNHYKMGPG